MDAAGSLALAKPEEVGLSAARLARLTDALSADIERKLLPGAVALIARRGRIAYWRRWVCATRRPAARCARTPSSASIR
jgi:hypothetical protein